MNPKLNYSPIRVELIEMTTDELCYALSRFVLEVRKESGEEYPSETLYELIICIQLYLSSHGIEVKLLQDAGFISLKNTLDNRMKDLSSKGIRVERKQADMISMEDETKMWDTGILGIDTPQKLLDTVLYLFGLHFALRAGQEHRNLRFVNSQIVLHSDGEREYLRYTEDTCKTSQGGLKHRRVVPKCVDAYDNQQVPQRCIVSVYKEYISRRPPSEKCSPAFYLRPLSKPTGYVWYSSQPVGFHQLTRTVKRLCREADMTGHFTNHSLRATAASRLYRQNFDEQLICETTGHRSSAVRSYKRTSDGQRKAISAALAGATETPVAALCSDNGKGMNVTVNINVK